VVHYLIDQQGLKAERLRAVGYGEFHPVSPNETAEGRRQSPPGPGAASFSRSQNRRVEIVILPKDLQKEKASR
jgi:chemotaxis protein MotB